MLYQLLLAGLAVGAIASPVAQAPADQPVPKTGDNGQPNGVFSFDITKIFSGKGGKSGALPGLGGPGGLPKGTETPAVDLFDDNSEGTGKYPAFNVQDGPTGRYTVYAPKTPPPADVKLPVLVYATCGGAGTAYKNLLTEVASHGYFVIAAGPAAPKWGAAAPAAAAPPASPPAKSPYTATDVGNMKFAIDWVSEGKAAKYGNIDIKKIATGGLSCGGLSAMSTAYKDDRVGLSLVLHSGVVDEDKRYLLKELKAPIGYIIGGPKDIAYENAEADWPLLPNIPAVKVNLDSAHIGTMFAPNAGKEGWVVLALLDHFLKGDAAAKALFFDKDSKLFKAGFNITTKNW